MKMLNGRFIAAIAAVTIYAANRKRQTLAAAVLLGACICSSALGQAPPPTILILDIENVVEYQADTSDPKKLGTNPNVTPVDGPIKNFKLGLGLGDIVAVNGQPVKGSWAVGVRQISLKPAPTPGQAISDSDHTSIKSHNFEILRSDGTAIGTIMGAGLDSGLPPAGAPSDQTRGDFAIVGGTGAFLGARGQFVQRAQVLERVPPRLASMSEDPANRRINGGGTIRYYLHLIPMTVPQIVSTATGPAVTHATDFTLVTALKPAAAGEILSLFASGLGPTRPAVDPGQPFPSNPAAVNSPVDVIVNGKPAEVLGAVGFPGAVDSYQVNFRMPSDTAQGSASIQVSAAWIIGPAANIRVQQ